VEQFYQSKKLLKRFFQIIISVSIIQSIIAIIQFLMQRSIGLIWLKESIISQDILGVAKIIFNGHPYIRAYGLFPHPNILGGFLVASIMISISYYKLFHVEQFDGFKKYLKTCFKNFRFITIVPRGTICMVSIISIQGLALLLTFSKSAIIGLFIGFFYLGIKKCSTPVQMFHVEHSTGRAWNIFSVFKMNSAYKKVFLILIILILTLIILRPDIYSLLFKSLQERSFYLNVSRGTFLSHPLIGIGSGQFVINMQSIAGIQTWQYQPVHNVFLLVLNEFGIIIFFMFLYFIYKMFHVEHFPEQTLGVYFKAILAAFVFIMLFDHYFWDIQQGQILLWLAFGFIVGSNKK